MADKTVGKREKRERELLQTCVKNIAYQGELMITWPCITRIIPVVLLLVAGGARSEVAPAGSPPPQRRMPSKTEVESDYRHLSPEALERWYDLKYGFRIHWGLYAVKPVGPESWPLTSNGLDFMA